MINNDDTVENNDVLVSAMAAEAADSTSENVSITSDYSGPDVMPAKEMTLNALGWATVERRFLGYGGMYYDPELIIEVKPFSSEEVLHFTAVNEDNPFEVDAATRYVLERCVRVRIGSKELDTAKTIFNHDRLALMMLCRTFSDMRTKLTFPKTCSDKKCGHVQTENINVQNMVYNSAEKINKFWNGRYFNIETKSGNVKYKPLTIFESNDVLAFTMEHKDDPEVTTSKLKVLQTLYPYLIVDCRTAVEAYDELTGMKKDKIALLTAIAEAYPVSTTLKVKSVCEKCDKEEDVAMRFPDGITSIVLDKVKIDDILL